MRNFSALTRSNQEWRHEEELQKRVDDYFLRVKSSLSFEEIQSLFKKKEEEYLLNHAHLLVRGKKVQTTLFLSQEEKKKEVYLLKLRLVLPRTKKHKTREFSQIYCLKKNAKP